MLDNARQPARIAWVAIEPLPYQLAFFDSLRRETGLDLRCFFCQVPGDGRLPESYRDSAEPESAGLVARGKAWPKILRAIATRPWDAVVLAGYGHSIMLAAMVVCLVRGIPFLVHSDTHRLRSRPPVVLLIKRLLLFPLLRHCAAAMGLGKLQAEYFRSAGIPEERIFTVAPVAHLTGLRDRVFVERASRGMTRAQWDVPAEAVVGVFVGRLERVKGVDLLLEGLARLSPERRPHLLIVGNGSQRPALQELVGRDRLPVRFLGSVRNADLGPLYAAADFFVLPSRAEGWGIAVAEAMAAGLPVVLSDQVGAAYDLLEEDRNGMLVRGRSAECWADALARCVARRDELPAMGDRSREIISSWTAERSARQFAAAVRAATQAGK